MSGTETVASLYAAHAAGNVKAGVDVDLGEVKDKTVDSVWDLHATKYGTTHLHNELV